MTPMVVQCSSCLTEFELDPDKVPAAGVRARCSVCSAVIVVPAPPAAPSAVPEATSAHAEPEHTASAQPVSAPSVPELAVPEYAPPAAPAPASIEAEHPTPEPAPAAAAPVAHPEPVHDESVHSEEGHVDAQPGASVVHAEPAHSEPVFAPPPPPPPVPQSVQTPVSAPRATEPAWGAPRPAATPSISHAETDAGQRRPINPFLTRDPALRAKRLARALVSDIVAYHPARHAEGLRDGTLKTLFRDEIKKSYEEYVDQVGRDFAGSTTHFQDALNDVLASGRKLF